MSSRLPTQEDLKPQLERMISGNLLAFEEILSIFEKPIFNHLIRLVRDYDIASDLLQETFVRLYQNRSRINATDNFKNWIYRVATNIAYDYFRKKKRENLVPIDDEILSETIEKESAYSSFEREILSTDLESALKEIRPHYRNVLLLYYREGFSYEEIAGILELPLNTIKTHLRRARQELGVLLKKTYG